MSTNDKLLMFILFSALLQEIENIKGNEKTSMVIFLASFSTLIFYLWIN
jgi:hypothetical protein